MSREVFHVACHHDALRRAGLTSLAAVREAQGALVRQRVGEDEVLRLTLTDADGKPVVCHLKRNIHPIRRQFWQMLLLRRGRPISTAQAEWHNLRRVAEAGVNPARPIAWGAQRGLLGERFSFVLTEAAPGIELEVFAKQDHDRATRRAVSKAVARTLARLHAARIGLPTLFAKHVYVDLTDPTVGVTLSSLDHLSRPLAMKRRRARDLAQLHLSIPKLFATRAERLHFLRHYAGRTDRRLLRRATQWAIYLESHKPSLSATYRGADPVA